ncbi:hypothetical protein [Croceicoccus naphthovorans]|uniref:Uncharacterized protein n=1 Tax=Croceicoccus naphthovorans TaxID=1348774 RepID=A0A0G3XGF4_9SPHN|nr:hypothetical protein [Croceicoccus naphthovorans]AKM09689.1 hypothetical protein AB433_06360 [Croceicoccus naphthovorans]MBB3990818.1 hypothetical protein [Croceicoccus naphthovorans]
MPTAALEPAREPALAPTAAPRRFRAAMLRRPTFGRRKGAALPPIAEDDTGTFRITNQDVRDFLMAYSACFMAVIGFFA